MVFNFTFFELIILFILSFCIDCASIFKPSNQPESSKELSAPDYSTIETWAALPTKSNPSNETPAQSTRIKPKNPKVDVFFIHPTTYLLGKQWNADWQDTKINERTDSLVLKRQASAFNTCCSIYAPRYRQASIFSFLPGNEAEGEKALDFAYKDVQKAFIYFIENHNQNRPWILASHSQGTRHGVRLIKEMVAGTPLEKTLIAAYLIGMPFTQEDVGIKICNSATEKNCAIGWSTYLKNTEPNRWVDKYSQSICTNPLNWTSDSTEASKELHKGYIDKEFNLINKPITGAKCEKGLLYIDYPGSEFPTLGKGKKDYHLVDISLFYENIRENLELRIQ